MASKKVPKNYDTTWNRRKQRLAEIEANTLPDVTADDNGKILKVTEGAWGIGEDENTIIIANPEEGSASEELENLQIGNTIYAVNKPTFDTIKGLRITIENGGQYNTNKPIIEFYDDGGNKASITSSDYTVTCDKTYAGNAELDQVCSIETPSTPGSFTYLFVNDFNTSKYHFIKLTRGGTFLTDIAKNIKLELTSDGENWLTLWDETTITWSDAVTYHMIDIENGEEASTLLPIVTSADNGKVLSVVNGIWDKGDIPNELPTVTSSDNGLYLEVIDGEWSKNLLTEGSVISEKSKPILAYVSGKPTSSDDQGSYTSCTIDIEDRFEHRLDCERYIDTTNLKIMLIVNGHVIFNKNYEDVFWNYYKLVMSIDGRVYAKGNHDGLKRQYADIISADTNVYDLVYFRFMSDIVLGAPVPAT